jgi:BirA family biotin operon repressor/biotin-[acetyl-CoA-carboxylase] ligase
VATPFASGAALALFDRIDSTSHEARRRAESGQRGPLWIVALEQTSGYGRRGTRWESGMGDVAATFLFDPGAPAEKCGQLSFVAALAVADAIAMFAPSAGLTLKWPNDVLANGAKIAGILLELVGGSRGPRAVTLGIGVNIVTKLEEAQYPTARLLDFRAEAPAALDVVNVLDRAFDARRRTWTNEGFAPIRAAFLARAARLGKKIRIQLPDETLEGVFEGIDSDGALVLSSDGSQRIVAAAAILPTR